MKKVLLFVLVIGLMVNLFAQDIRPVRDDVGFCWDGQQFSRLMDYLKTVDKETGELPLLVAGISPHDDYLYAGTIYYPLFKQISRTAKEVVIFGVTHGTVRKKIGDPRNILIFDSYSLWKGPYKKVKISKLRGYLKEKLDSQLYITNNEAHELEHSIEAMIPFLQYFNRDIQVTPIMVTGMDFETMERVSAKLASVIASYIKESNLELGKDIFFLISADANHYGKDFDNAIYGEGLRAHQLGTERDRKIANTFLSGKMDREKVKGLTGELWGKTYRDYKDTVWCGKYSIPFGMLTVIRVVKRLGGGKELAGKVIRYSDTYTQGVIPLKKPGFGITAPFSLKHWVGFFSAGYYLK
jgi:AmmeMemoRadiSam system protein B